MKMKTLHITTPEIQFDIEVPADMAASRAVEIAEETNGTVTM